MSLIGLLVSLIIVGLCWWAVNAILRAFGIGDPIATIVKVLFVVAVVLWLLSAVGVLGVPTIRLS